MDFKIKLENLISYIDKSLNYYIENMVEENIKNPIRYTVNAGGKRFRPIILLSTIEAFGGNIKDGIAFASSIEFIHTYSLIHDDLPAMDNDDLRRGLPTCHIKFDEATAILAGDALLNLAFELMSYYINENFQQKYVLAMYEIAKASGSKGMIGGQVSDIYSENKNISFDELIYIHTNKTAKLISASMVTGAIIANASKEKIEKIRNISNKIGIAFQIKDDILDIEGNKDLIGKNILSDIQNKKTTYVSLKGLEKAKEDYQNLSIEILKDLEDMNFENTFIYEYIKTLINREK